MQNRIISKALCLTATAVLSCTSILGSGNWLTASANISVGDYSNDAMQKVIVKVSGDAVLATEEGASLGADYLDTAAAEKAENVIETAQSRVQRSIRQFYPELTVSFSYSTLYNGFCCELPESLVPYVREVPLVESVTVVPDHIELKMATAPAFSDYPAYYNETGCTGEGQVICVIDSELDISHPMFAPLADDIETRLSKEDIAEIIASGDLNIACNADVAYRSNKLPFVVDYVDEDQEAGLLFPEMYHGTHVSGIAAGNQIEDENGRIISGIARDAQLIFLSIGSRSLGGIDFGAALAATEDAVKLKADVINMSWGTDFEFFGADPFSECIATAQNAGVMVCIAAGNADNGNGYGRTPTVDTPDTGTLTDKCDKGSTALLVASANNLITETYPSFLVGDRRIKCSSYIENNTNEEHTFSEMLDTGDYEYVYLGEGLEEDFADRDLSGKIALIDFPVEMEGAIYAAFESAFHAGAIGVIMIDTEDDLYFGPFWNGYSLPGAIVSHEDGQFMIEAENKVITNDREIINVDIPSEVSFYTSWGVRESLDLRPDIMGIGGYVESAGYEGTEEIMSGTSMATPYMCGCVAELCQYMREKGIELTGAEKTQFIHNILMNSAVPYTEEFETGTMYVTPRRQGAGMVNLNNAIHDKVLMTGDEGAAKVNLYDNLTDSFSFNVNLQNLSDEDVVFTNARLELTTDDHFYLTDYNLDLIDGQQALSSSADLSSLLQISAGETRTEGIQVALDAAQTAAISEIFTNGFFVEGYLVLEGAENCCDISIPLLGYYGDWAQLPILYEGNAQTAVKMGESAVLGGYSLAHEFNEILAEMEMNEEVPGTNHGITFISPNGDGLADKVGMEGFFRRQCIFTLVIRDAEGNVVAETDDMILQDKDIELVAETNGLMEDLPEGEYTIELKANIDYPASYENPQVYTASFTIDKTAPEVTTDVYEQDGRTILKMTCSDDRYLDSVMILGKGMGGEPGTFDPVFSWGDMNDLNYMLDAKNHFIAGASFQSHIYDNADLSMIGHLLTGTIAPDALINYNFFDFIPATPDGQGTFTLEYDITDLTDYTISVFDGAFNFTDVASEKAPSNFIKNGVWACKKGFYEFSNLNVKFIDVYDGSSVSYTYTLNNGTLNLSNRRNSETIEVTPIDETHLRFTFEDGETLFMKYEGYVNWSTTHTVWELEDAVERFMTREIPDDKIDSMETMVFSPEDVRITVIVKDPVVEYALSFGCSVFSDYAMTSFTLGGINLFEEETTKIRPGTYYEYDWTKINYVVFNEDGESGCFFDTDTEGWTDFTYAYNEETAKMDFTVKHDATEDSEEETVVYSARVTTDASGGIYIYEPDPYYGEYPHALYYISDETINPVDLHRYDELAELVLQYMTAVTGSELIIVDHYLEQMMQAFTLSDGTTVTIDPFTATGYDSDGFYVDLYNIPYLYEGAQSLETLKEWAIIDYTSKNPETPYARARIIENNRVAVILVDEWGYPVDIYTLDALSAAGTNQYGEEVNLPQTGNNAPAGAATVAAAVLMMLIGTGTAAGSGILRRKKEHE